MELSLFAYLENRIKMNTFVIGYFFLPFILCTSCQSDFVKNDGIIIENELFSKSFHINLDKPGSIQVAYFSKINQETVTNEQTIPYFEFVINHKIVSSKDQIWILDDHLVRKLKNGGTEHALIFDGGSLIEGLQVIILQQIFPRSTLIREKLEIKTKDNSFTLNKLNGKLHFNFPVYSINPNIGNDVDLTEVRIASWEDKPITFGTKDKGNHMFYPSITNYIIDEEKHSFKGPIAITSNGKISWFTAYEHASQDNLNGFFKNEQMGQGNMVNDAMQGTKGFFNFAVTDSVFRFIEISSQSKKDGIHISVELKRGGYLDGEIISRSKSYSSVWIATGFYSGNNFEDGKAMLRNYLSNQICEKPVSRIPKYYYNTWGMQREDNTKSLRGIMTYERIREEIEYAAELGVDIFVLDDGWENKQGEWIPNKERLPQGLTPIKEHLDKFGMKMGIWFSPMGIDSTSSRYQNHREWVIKDSNNKPIKAQWGHPAFDFVSDFFYLFVEDCKKLIDEGCLYMKWDAINTFYSSLPGLHHGDSTYSEEERRARYEYLLPIYVTEAMRILTEYEPELIIEIDLTEAHRAMIGLAPLSEGKLFWMNNGVSRYNDYSSFRSKSLRTIVNQYAGLIPIELFTYANYPHDLQGRMDYNVHNSMLAGHGFWGNLQLMTPHERKWVGNQIEASKKVSHHLIDVNPIIVGEVGDSPEIYSIVNEEKASGQIICFSEKANRTEYTVRVNSAKIMVALNHPYEIKNDSLYFSLIFSEEESSKAIFILPNEESDVSIISTTAPITNANFENNRLKYTLSEQGIQTIKWNKRKGKPLVESSNRCVFQYFEGENNYILTVEAEENSTILIY